MKSFSIFKLPFFITLICVLIPAAFSHAAGITSSDNKKDQIRQLETDLSREKEQYLKFDLKEKNILETLSSLEKAVAEKRRLMGELREKIRLSRDELKRQQKILSQQKHTLMKLEERMSQRLVSFYKYAKRGYGQILATSRDLNQLRRRMKYLKVFMNEDYGTVQQMADEQLKYKRKLYLTRKKIAEINSMEKLERSRLLSIKKDVEKKVILLTKIHKEKEFYETAVKELELAAQLLKKTLLKLERDQEKRKPLPLGFAELKGRLPPPFDGRFVRQDRKVRAEIVNTHKGVYIEGSLGVEVKAIFAGRVDFSGRLKGYGEIIVINHGSRFFTISAHLSQRIREEGEMVDKGDVIGLLGQIDSRKGPRLYFEIRKAGANLDPLKWLKVN
jgi:septal ring factor EnvC (AmiA/AmiB activator)